MLSRSSGVLLHPTSLPGGRLGEDAFRFIDWLSAAGQSWWQILPLGPPDEEGSPYRAASAFACWEGLLADPEAPVSPHEIDDFVSRHPYWAGEWAAFAGDGALSSVGGCVFAFILIFVLHVFGTMGAGDVHEIAEELVRGDGEGRG